MHLHATIPMQCKDTHMHGGNLIVPPQKKVLQIPGITRDAVLLVSN